MTLKAMATSKNYPMRKGFSAPPLPSSPLSSTPSVSLVFWSILGRRLAHLTGEERTAPCWHSLYEVFFQFGPAILQDTLSLSTNAQACTFGYRPTCKTIHMAKPQTNFRQIVHICCSVCSPTPNTLSQDPQLCPALLPILPLPPLPLYIWKPRKLLTAPSSELTGLPSSCRTHFNSTQSSPCIRIQGKFPSNSLGPFLPMHSS